MDSDIQKYYQYALTMQAADALLDNNDLVDDSVEQDLVREEANFTPTKAAEFVARFDAISHGKRGQALHLTQPSGRIDLDFLIVKVVEKSGSPWFGHRNDWSTVNHDISTVFRAVKAYINGVNCGT